MGAEVTGVVARTIDQGGFSTSQELSPHKVAGGPNNGFDLARRQIHSKWRRRLNTGWRKAMWWAYCGIEAALMRPLVDPAIPRAIENAFEI
jgi:hypothetical protein